jgi:hypothetical protein
VSKLTNWTRPSWWAEVRTGFVLCQGRRCLPARGSGIVTGMKARHGIRRWLSGTLVLAMLFAQLATSAYACPAARASGDAGAEAQPGLMAPQGAMPCGQMLGAGMMLDADAPGLCQQHCQFGNTQQAGDAVQPMPQVTLALLYVVPKTALALPAGAAWGGNDEHLERAPPLPHSIAHCCYRL